MQLGIAGHKRAAIWPQPGFVYQFGAAGIRQNLKTDFGERSALSLFLAQTVVVGLMLKTMRAQRRGKVFAQELHPVALVGIKTQSHPQQVNMVGHQAIRRAEQPFARGGVKHDFAELRMKQFVEPAGAAQCNRHRPVDDRVALIIFAVQTREIKAPVRALAGISDFVRSRWVQGSCGGE